MWQKTLLLKNNSPYPSNIEEAFDLNGMHCRRSTPPSHLHRHLVVTITGQDYLNEPRQYTQIECCPIYFEEHNPSWAWIDLSITATELSQEEKLLLRSWLLGRSYQAWEQTPLEVRQVFLLESCVLLTGRQAHTILHLWQVKPEGRWKVIFDDSAYDNDEDFALYPVSCPHSDCSADVLSGFGGSGDSSDISLALCCNQHTSWFGPDGTIRTEKDVEGDCWQHQWPGPASCPSCQAQQQYKTGKVE